MGIYARHNAEWYRVDECGGAGADLVGGVAGWASIDSVSGTADLTTLQNDGIAPTSATEDPDVPGTYNVIENGVEWRVAVFTGDGSVTTQAGGLVDALLVSGGGPDMGGRIAYGMHHVSALTHEVVVGSTGASNRGSCLGEILTPSQGSAVSTAERRGAGGFGVTVDEQRAGVLSSITGIPFEYGAAWKSSEKPSGIGDLGTLGAGSSTKAGIVIVRSPKDATSNQAPDAPVAWGKFGETVPDYDDTGEWEDGKGRRWKWYEFNDPNKTPTIDLTGGMYWVLTVGGGGYESESQQYLNQGQPGLVNEGYWEFSTNPSVNITVGRKGQLLAGQDISKSGAPSSVGDYGTQGFSTYGHSLQGRGATTWDDSTGYTSLITGGGREYATGYNVSESRPGRAGRTGSPSSAPTDGCVIIAAVVNEPNDWNPPGELPGLGGWATITDVKGKGNKYSYGDWVAFEWTADGELTSSGGLVDLFMISAGARADNVYPGSGGRTVSGLHKLEGTQQDITIGKKVTSGTERAGPASTLGSITTYYSAHYYGGSGATDPSGNSDEGRAGYPSNILGFDETFGETGDYYGAAHVPRANRGDGGKKSDGAGSDGVVIVRVPKANYTGNLPDGAFDVPTTRQTIVEALEEKVEEAKEAVRDRRSERRKRR